jgi:hypothetical protein
MRKSQPPVYYLVGTPKGRLGHLEKDLAERPWEAVRQGVEVKLLPQDGELYVLAQSRDRVCKERAMRRRQLKKLWKRLKQLQAMKLSSKDLLLKLGEARGHYRAAWRLIDFELPEAESKSKESARFCFALNRKKLRDTRRREGRYLLRSNLCEKDPALLWRLYTLLTQIEEAFKNLKGDLAIRPIFHQLASKPTSSSPSSLIACTSPCTIVCANTPRDLPHAPCSKSSPPSRCLMLISRPLTVAGSSLPVTHSPKKITAFCSPTSVSNCLLNPRHASPQKEIFSITSHKNPCCRGDLFKPSSYFQSLTVVNRPQ